MEKINKDVVPMIDTACSVMDYIFNHDGEAGISSISVDLGLSKSTVFRIIKTLESWDFIQKNEINDKYQLGTFFIKAGEQKKYNLDLAKVSKPIMEELANELGETINLGSLYENKVLSLESVSGETSGLISKLPPMFELYCSGIGKLLMAEFTKEELEFFFEKESISPKTISTITNIKNMESEIEKIKANGYSVDDEEYEYGLYCIAAPIFSADKKMIAGISISGPKSRMEHKGMDSLEAKIIQAGKNISKKLGYK